MTGTRAYAAFGAALVLALLLAACGSDDEGDQNGEGRLNIVASTSIIAALAEEVAGDDASVTALMEPGVDPHTFETTPGDARAIADADLVLINGLELDNFLIDDVEAAGGDVPVITVTDGIELLEAGGEAHDEHEGDEHDHGDVDPHVWQDPLRVKVMVDNIAEALAQSDPDRAEQYRDNAAAYGQTLDETHAEIQSLIEEIPPDRRKIVTNHEAFSYFADRYGLEIIGTVVPGLSSEADPSAGDIAALVDLIQQEGVTAIFTEDLLDPSIAEQLAEDAGIEVVHGLYTGQVGAPGSGAETVHDMLLANARKISEALR